MSIENEFATVDLVANAGVATSGIDAFALGVIKAERQIRRLFKHIVFQCLAFTRADVPALRTALWERRAGNRRQVGRPCRTCLTRT